MPTGLCSIVFTFRRSHTEMTSPELIKLTMDNKHNVLCLSALDVGVEVRVVVFTEKVRRTQQ